MHSGPPPPERESTVFYVRSLSSTLTVLLDWFATARSGFWSPWKSPTAGASKRAAGGVVDLRR